MTSVGETFRQERWKLSNHDPQGTGERVWELVKVLATHSRPTASILQTATMQPPPLLSPFPPAPPTFLMGAGVSPPGEFWN